MHRCSCALLTTLARRAWGGRCIGEGRVEVVSPNLIRIAQSAERVQKIMKTTKSRHIERNFPVDSSVDLVNKFAPRISMTAHAHFRFAPLPYSRHANSLRSPAASALHRVVFSSTSRRVSSPVCMRAPAMARVEKPRHNTHPPPPPQPAFVTPHSHAGTLTH